MADSKYISIPTTETHKNYGPANGTIVNSDNDDVITLNILTMCNGNDDNNSTNNLTTNISTVHYTNARPTTPTPNKRLFARKPKNLHLKISSSSPETENVTLSSGDTFKSSINKSASAAEAAADDTNNSTSSMTPSISTTTSTASASTSNSIFPHEQNRTTKKLNIGFKNIRYTARTGFFRRVSNSVILQLDPHEL
ncbi:hypothetical protein DOY81_014113 [Sarcophaga bullata]|nr:hypothetical protein DOY81_014113 [Sarcophaga bullata]